MKITLGVRTAGTVSIYFNKANNPLIRRMLPQKARTVGEAIRDYEQTLLPDAASFGKIILADGNYVGDIWCYCIHRDRIPNAMVSYCIFETAYWNKGIATGAMQLFLPEIIQKYDLHTVGAFTFSDNLPSIKVLEKNGFVMLEEFTESGISSKYFQYQV